MFIDEEATPALIRALLQAGAGVDVHDDSGNTPLFAAVESGKVELVQTLIEAGADVNASAEEGETALMRAVDRGYIEVVKALIITGSDINIRDKGEESAWDKTSDPEMEEVLVEAGAIVSYDVEVEKEPPTKNKKNNK